VTKPEIKLIAEHLEMTEPEFRKKYIRRVGFRTTIVEDKGTKDCIFLQKGKRGRTCVIYPVRPNQCRTWPFWSANLKSPVEWNNAVKKCIGINRNRFHSFEEIEKIRKSNKWWLKVKKQRSSSKK